MLKALLSKFFRLIGKNEDTEEYRYVGQKLYDSIKRGDWGTEK